MTTIRLAEFNMALPIDQEPPETCMLANEKEKIDHVLLSHQLRKLATQGYVCRKGFYAPKKWESYENINKDTKDRNQASDHHCVWVDLDLG